jgi:Ca-activated chloride channel family protein
MNFTFGTPYFLLLLFFIPCFVWCKLPTKRYYFPKLAWVERETPLFAWELWLKVLIFSSLIIALAKPLVYDTKSNQHRKGRDLILAIDASGSMAQSGFNETDRFKNKFETNIELATDFIAKRFDDNMGIVLFGTFAYTASPLTYDLKSLSHMLSLTNVGLAGESTAIGEAIIQSITTLSFGEAKNRVIVLLSDGFHNAGKTSPKQAVQKAKALGIKIYTIGIGKKSDYDVALLETIAKETGGESYSASSASKLSNIYQEIDKLEPSSIRSEGYLHEKLLILYPLSFAFMLLLGWTIIQNNKNNSIIHKIHFIILLLLTVAMFRPSLAQEEIEGKVEGEDIIIALDVSFSMSATDISPSRYLFAKETIRFFLEQNPHSNIMLIAFTSNPLLLSPPTTDHGLVLVALESLNPQNILTKGTSLKRLFEKIVIIKKEGESGHKEIILITDGGEESKITALTTLLNSTDISLHILAMGTEQGSTLPTHDDGFLKDEQGNLIITRVNPLLNSLAQNVDDGSYIISKESPKETAKLLTNSLHGKHKEIEKKEYKKLEYKKLELYYLPLSIAIILFMMLHTRGRRYLQKITT